jgi:hypothetical protein
MDRERLTLSEKELAEVLQRHFRAFVAGVRFAVKPNGEVALEVNFAQPSLKMPRQVASAR